VPMADDPDLIIRIIEQTVEDAEAKKAAA
jgi:hypothetical protein